MRLIVESRLLKFMVEFLEPDDDVAPQIIYNSGGDFQPAPIEGDDDYDESEPDERFGFHGRRHG